MCFGELKHTWIFIGVCICNQNVCVCYPEVMTTSLKFLKGRGILWRELCKGGYMACITNHLLVQFLSLTTGKQWNSRVFFYTSVLCLPCLVDGKLFIPETDFVQGVIQKNRMSLLIMENSLEGTLRIKERNSYRQMI